jgi:hypothetical protein
MFRFAPQTTMNLELTTKEYLTLIKAVYLADCVANAHATDPAETDREISRLRRKVFSRAGEAGFAELVRHDVAHDDFVETEDLAEEMDEAFIRRHVDMVFWRELASRLTESLMDKKFGPQMDGWNEATYQRHRDAIQRKVEAELQTNGMDNLFLLGDF